MAKILVVDDSHTIASTVGWLLRNNDHEVRIESDGLAVLNALRVFNPDLLLLDILLPHVDGFQLCLVIRRLAPFADLPIVMMSGLSKPDDIQRALDAGATDYLVKPVDDARLINVINHYLDAVPANTEAVT